MGNENGDESGSGWGGFWISLVGGLLCVVAIDAIFGSVMDDVYARSSKNPLANIERANTPWLSLGSSISKYALDPSVMTLPIYNGGQNGQGIYYVIAVLSALPEDTAVKNVIWFYDPADLVEPVGEGNSLNLRAITPLSKDSSRLKTWIAAGDKLKSLALHSNLYRYRLLAPGIVIRAIWPQWSLSGYAPVPFDGSAQDFASQKSAQSPDPSQQDVTERLVMSNDGRHALQVLAEIVKNRTIQLVVVSPPIWGDKRTTNPVYTNLYTQMRSALSGVGVCDLTGPLGSGLNHMSTMESLFFDGAHFNHQGAQYFSRRLDRLIKKSCLTR